MGHRPEERSTCNFLIGVAASARTRHYARVAADLEASMRELAEGLRGRASLDAERAVGAPLDPRIDDSMSLLDHGERGIGLENLLSNIYEFDVALTENEVDVIEELAKAWGLANERWTFVKELQQ